MAVVIHASGRKEHNNASELTAHTIGFLAVFGVCRCGPQLKAVIRLLKTRSEAMSCKSCAHLEDVTDLSTPYVERTCAECGRKINLREPGANGHGIRVEKGDQFRFPKGWLQFAANPLKGTGHFTKHGLEWFAKLISSGGSKKVARQLDEFPRSVLAATLQREPLRPKSALFCSGCVHRRKRVRGRYEY